MGAICLSLSLRCCGTETLDYQHEISCQYKTGRHRRDRTNHRNPAQISSILFLPNDNIIFGLPASFSRHQYLLPSCLRHSKTLNSRLLGEQQERPAEHTASFPAETHGGKGILENIIWWTPLMLCVLRARYDSAVPSTTGQHPTNYRTSANLVRGAE